jgi:hypothetical protein
LVRIDNHSCNWSIAHGDIASCLPLRHVVRGPPRVSTYHPGSALATSVAAAAIAAAPGPAPRTPKIAVGPRPAALLGVLVGARLPVVGRLGEAAHWARTHLNTVAPGVRDPPLAHGTASSLSYTVGQIAVSILRTAVSSVASGTLSGIMRKPSELKTPREEADLGWSGQLVSGQDKKKRGGAVSVQSESTRCGNSHQVPLNGCVVLPPHVPRSKSSSIQCFPMQLLQSSETEDAALAIEAGPIKPNCCMRV